MRKRQKYSVHRSNTQPSEKHHINQKDELVKVLPQQGWTWTTPIELCKSFSQEKNIYNEITFE